MRFVLAVCAALTAFAAGAATASAALDTPQPPDSFERLIEEPVNGHQDPVDAEFDSAREVAEVRAEARLAAAAARRELFARYGQLPAGVSRGTLESIASCESGGDPTAVSSDGAYRGKYQFHPSTWTAVGGSGDPAAAPEVEQDYRAALLYVRSGPGQWPICGS